MLASGNASLAILITMTRSARTSSVRTCALVGFPRMATNTRCATLEVLNAD